MNWNDFTIGFWHPFGTHAGESRDQILARKQLEIDRNGWTLWSFQYRKTLDAWRNMLPDSKPVYVLCSDSPNAVDPQTRPQVSRSYRTDSGASMQPIPVAISVPHPANARGLGSAFIVDEIIVPGTHGKNPDFGICWRQTASNQWRSNALPTRGEYLI